MKFTKFICAIAMALLSLSLTNCAKDLPPGDYDSAEVGQIKKVVPGTVISMRAVRLHSRSADVATGNAAYEQDNNDSGVNRSHGFEYVIRLNSGEIISVVQAEDIKLKPKQRILVIYGSNTRVVPDNGSEDY